MKSSVRLIRIFGIDIGVHYTWLFIFGLVAWSLADGYFPDSYPDWSTTAYWITGVIASFLLFVSVLVHELAHSLVARSRGLPVRSITLFLFGGVSNLEEEPKSAGVEFVMAVVGPLSSLVLGGIFWGIWQMLSNQDTPPAGMLSYLAWINVLLAAFNLLPAFPLDGGRVLRSILWGATKSLQRATHNASVVGEFFGWAFIVFGFFQVLGGNFLGGLWIAFIGWFLTNAAAASRREMTLREHLSGVKVRELMQPSPDAIDPNASVRELVEEMFRRRHHRAVPVCHDNRPVGIVTVTDIKKAPQNQWTIKKVSDIMTREPLYSVNLEDDLEAAFALISQHDVNQVLVLRDAQCAGLLSRADIIQHLRLSRELGAKPKPGQGNA
ncbi:MAG: site-2 protease family protein [Dehalococcoidia bacterium]|nr:site-2 protease family protein [Dehalococcoidia bacterium]